MALGFLTPAKPLTLSLRDVPAAPAAGAWRELVREMTRHVEGVARDDGEIFYRHRWRPRREFHMLRETYRRRFLSYLDGDCGLPG